MKKKKPESVYVGLGEGMVAVGIGKVLGFGVYEFNWLNSSAEINTPVDDKDYREGLPTVRIMFSTTAAVTREIRRLQRLRKLMRKKPKTKKRPYCGAL